MKRVDETKLWAKEEICYNTKMLLAGKRKIFKLFAIKLPD